MNFIVYALFFSVFFLDYLHSDLGIIPRYGTWIPELLSIAAYMVVFMRLAARKSINLPGKYVFLIFAQLFIVLTGVLLNEISLQELVVGLRFYFKTLPFFLLPTIYDFTDEQINKQFKVLLPLLMLQFPLTIYQRFFQFKGELSGDPISGTLQISSALSITMICAMAVLIGFYLRKRIHPRWFLVIIAFLFFPTTLNETKGTYVLLPLAIFIPYFLLEKSNRPKIKVFFFLAMASLFFFFTFQSIYNRFADTDKNPSLLEFFSDQDKLVEYFYRDTTDDHKIRRGDSIIIAIENISQDPLRMFFGYGVGSVQASFFKSGGDDPSDEGQYKAQMLTVTNLLWELGFLGVFTYILFFPFLFRDVMSLKVRSDFTGDFSVGWSAVICIIAATLVYKNMLLFNVLNYLFWYFSGILISRKYQMLKV